MSCKSLAALLFSGFPVAIILGALALLYGLIGYFLGAPVVHKTLAPAIYVYELRPTIRPPNWPAWSTQRNGFVDLIYANPPRCSS